METDTITSLRTSSGYRIAISNATAAPMQQSHSVFCHLPIGQGTIHVRWVSMRLLLDADHLPGLRQDGEKLPKRCADSRQSAVP